jgi:hypothetical protein
MIGQASCGPRPTRKRTITASISTPLRSFSPNQIDYAKYSPGECKGTRKEPISGLPDRKDISTSHVERQKLNTKMGLRRFTRLTNAFSKRIDMHIYELSLYFVLYNFVRTHKAHTDSELTR